MSDPNALTYFSNKKCNPAISSYIFISNLEGPTWRMLGLCAAHKRSNLYRRAQSKSRRDTHNSSEANDVAYHFLNIDFAFRLCASTGLLKRFRLGVIDDSKLGFIQVFARFVIQVLSGISNSLSRI